MSPWQFLLQTFSCSAAAVKVCKRPSWRSWASFDLSASIRFITVTSVLKARESTVVLIMKASDSMNKSFRFGLAKGPHCNSVHPTANAEMISATVAVSVGPDGGTPTVTAE